MGSLSDYGDFFLLAQELSVRVAVPALLDPALRNPVYVGLWTVVLLYGLEFIVPWRRNQPKLRDGVWLDVFYTIANFLLFQGLVGLAIFWTAEAMFHHALHEYLGLSLSVQLSLENLPIWSRYLLLFLYMDLLNYWGHRLLHRVGFLWTFHQVHHSSRKLDVLNSVRLHWVETIYYRFVTYVPAGLVGFGVGEILAIDAFRFFFSNFTHANIKVPLGPAKYILNNPQLHIWHHAVEVDHKQNVNYGDALSLWDYLFGTAYLPDDRSELELGFEGIEEFPTTLWGQQTHPLGSAVSKLWSWARRGSRPSGVSPATATEPPGRGPVQVKRAVFAGSVAALVLAGMAIARDLDADEWRVLMRDGYQPQIASLLEEGRLDEALRRIERASYVDEARRPMMIRMTDLNQAARFQSKPMWAIGQTMLRDARLRWNIGNAVLAQLEAVSEWGDAERDLLDRAVDNARMLATLRPASVLSNHLLGTTLLMRATDSGSASDVEEAVSSLEKALSLDPSNSRVAEALERARRRQAAVGG